MKTASVNTHSTAPNNLPVAQSCLLRERRSLVAPPPALIGGDLNGWLKWFNQLQAGSRTLPTLNVPLIRLESREGVERSPDRLAFYYPAHNRNPLQYGIHLPEKGVRKVTDRIGSRCDSQPCEVRRAVAVIILFVHEACHGWIEDLVCLMSGEGADASLTSLYRKRRGDPDLHKAEEALCNTAAFRWARELLKNPGPSLPTFDAQAVICAVCEWMKGQPAGYRAFQDDLSELPHQSEPFMRQLGKVLKIYQGTDAHAHHSDRWVARALQDYFGARMTVDAKHLRPRPPPWGKDPGLWRRPVPVIWDP